MNRKHLLILSMFLLIVVFIAPVDASHNAACKEGSFTVSTGGIYDCGGENVGGSGATITISPNITVEWRNVGSFEAASITGNGPSYTAPSFFQYIDYGSYFRGTVTWCNNGWNAANVIINANSVSINGVSLNGGHGQNTASGSTCAGTGGHAGRFTATATGNINIDSISVIPGNGGNAGTTNPSRPPYHNTLQYTVGHSGNAGYVSLSGANIGGKTTSKMSISGRGGNGGNEVCYSSSQGYRCNYENQGRGSRGASVYISSPGTVNMNSISIPGGYSGKGGQQWNNGRNFYMKGGDVFVGYSTSATNQLNPVSLDITTLDSSTPGNSNDDQVHIVSINGGGIKLGSVSAGGGFANNNRIFVTGSGEVEFSSIGAGGGIYDTVTGSSTICLQGGRGGMITVKSLDGISGSSITASGANGNYNCGGGVGGSITVDSPDTTLSSVTARGGDGGHQGSAGGTLTIKGTKAVITGGVSLIGGNEIPPVGSFNNGGKGGTADFRNVIDVYVAGGVDLRSGTTSFTGQEGQIMLRTNYQGTIQGGVTSSQYSSFAIPPAVCVVVIPSG